jgi:cytochrome c biogenesis protein CcmG/thiol:disulfide interchange protein DsbE
MRRFIAFSALAAALLLSAVPRVSAQAGMPPLPIGSKAPAFITKTLSGQKLSLSSLRGHVVLLDYWATWCGPCRMATPTIEGLYREYARHGLRVVGLSVDAPNTVSQVPAAVRALHMTYLVSADPRVNALIAEHYNVTGIPAQFLIDKKGIIRWAEDGYSPMEGQELSAIIQKLLQKS